MTRLIVIGDTHIDASNPRNADRLAAWDQIIAHGRDLDDLEGWIHVGDIYHAESAPADRNAVAERLIQMAAIAPVVIVAGNHDAPGDLAILSRLDTEWSIAVVDTPRTVQLLEVRVAVLPYPFKAGLVGAGVSHEDLGAAARAALEPVFMAFGHELAAYRHGLFVGHVNIGGARTSAGQPSIGRELELDPALLARLGDVPKILGHIHLPQALHGATFVGSSSRMDFGEQEEKRFLVVEFSDHGWRLVSVPLVVPQQFHVDGVLTREGFTPDAPLPEVTGADVRVRYRFLKADAGVIDQAHIRAAVAGCRSLKLDAVPELEHSVRAPEIAAAVTLDEKVTRCAELQGVPMSDGLKAKLSALQAQPSEALLAELARALAVVGAQPADVEPARESAVA